MKNKSRAWEEPSALPGNRTNMDSLAALGRLASAFRNAGMRSVFNGIRDSLDAVALRLDLPPLEAEIDGIRLHGFLRHRSFLENLARGTYEPCTRKLFSGLLAETEVMVDAGAHIGLFSVLACRKGTSDLSVFSFEPDPYNGKALQYNLRKNRCANVRVLPMAVSDTTGTARFLISDGTLGSSLILGRTNIGATHTLLVPTAALDFTLQEIPLKSLLIKLDVEGGEIMALRGMSSVLWRASKVAIICEMNPAALQAGGQTPAGLVHLLQKQGLETFFISDAEGGLVPVTETFAAKGNLLCLKDWPIPKEWIRH
ncbi:MAG: FkbM family methyltransferase [Anaerolineales bacterium]